MLLARGSIILWGLPSQLIDDGASMNLGPWKQAWYEYDKCLMKNFAEVHSSERFPSSDCPEQNSSKLMMQFSVWPYDHCIQFQIDGEWPINVLLSAAKLLSAFLTILVMCFYIIQVNVCFRCFVQWKLLLTVISKSHPQENVLWWRKYVNA